MDLFSQFPESNNQNIFLPKINDEKIESNILDGDDSDNLNKQKNNKFENFKKVIALRKKNTLIMVIVITMIFLILFTFEEFLRNLSVKLIDNFAIKKKTTKSIITLIIKFNGYSFYPFYFLLYLNYPLQYSFTYFLSFVVTKYIHAILFLIYGVDRGKEISIKNFFESHSEKPNIQLQLTFAQFFGFWRLVKSKTPNKKESSKHKKIVNILFCLSMFFTILTFLEEIFVSHCSINMCLMGLIIGIIVYTTIYERLCFQLMKGKFFVKTMANNYFFFVFLTIIELLVAILLYHNYNGISDIFEIFNYNPWKDEEISQKTMNQIVLKKSLFAFLFLFMIMGIRSNYKFVISKKNKNYYNLEDIVHFNQGEKKSTIFMRIILFSSPGFIVMTIMNYLQYNYKIQLVFYLVTDIFIFWNFAYVYFGFTVKKSLKKHIDEGRELDEYQNLDYSDNKTPQDEDENKVNNLI